jgi:hypothetical protein
LDIRALTQEMKEQLLICFRHRNRGLAAHKFDLNVCGER